jgi:D-amino-acid dehydrogenase
VYYAQLIDQLQNEQDGDTGYALTGILYVAATEDELEPYAQRLAAIQSRQQSVNWPSSDVCYEISPAEARELFPAIGSMLRVLYIRDSARVDGRLINAAMLRAAENHGLKVKSTSVEKLLIENGAVTGVIADGVTIMADKVIIAGGAWTPQFGDQLGAQIPLYPKRGQIIHLSLPETDTSTWPIISAFHGHYQVPWHDNRVAVGATREATAGFNPVTTAAGVREVLDEALRVAPGLAAAQIKEIRVGLRPTTVDDLPVMGMVPGVGNIYLATGHGAQGLQLGPYSGKLAADWALGQPAEIDLSAFSITRFGV